MRGAALSLLVAAGSGALGGCTRGVTGAPSSDAASADAATAGTEAAQSAEAAALAPSSRTASPPAQSGEATRSTLRRLEDDALLRAHLRALREHFGPDAPGPFDVQRIGLAGGATALLVSRPKEVDPMVLVVDRDQPLWVKQRPTAGILPPVRHLALSPRPDGGVAVFAWVESLGMVAARMWADDSNPFGDFEVFAPDRCDTLSAGYAPALGWVVACTGPGGVRAARMRLDGVMPWGHGGIPLGARSAVGPATVAFDTPGSFVLLERAAAAGGERVLGYRFDGKGTELWEAPADLGAIGIALEASDRIRAASLEEGGVRVEPLPGRAVRGKRCDLASDGQVRPADH